MSEGALNFHALLTTKDFEAGMTRIRQDIRSASTTVQRESSTMDDSFRKLGIGLGTAFSGAALGQFVNKIIEVRGEFQKTEIAFGTMLRSTDKAKALMGQMVELAAKTPFSLQDVSSGAKQLLAFQVPAEEVVETLTRMGNIAAGLSVPLQRINLIYGQVKAKGKLAGDDLRQFTEAGIPMLAELAKKFDTNTAAVSKMVSAGKIGFQDVQDVLFGLTNEGGMFFNLMEKQSESLSGKIANLGDAFDQMLNSIGEANEGILGDSIEAVAYLVDNYETLIEIIGVAVATYGFYKAALIANLMWTKLNEQALVQQSLSHGALTLAQARGAAATVMFQRAQMGLNAAMMANPIGIVIGLLAGLSYVIYKNVTATDAYAEMQDKLNDKMRRHSSSLDEQKSKIDTLLKVIKDKNTSDKVAQGALDEINKLTKNRISGLTVEGIRLGQNTKALSTYLQVMEKEVRLRALIDEKIELEKRNKDIDRDNPNNITFGDRFINFQGFGDVLKGMTPQERKERAMLENRIATNKRIRENEAETQKLLQEGIKITDNEVVNTLNQGTEDITEAKEKRERELAEVYSLNSIADLEQRIELWNEALSKASGDSVLELKKDKYGDTQKTGNTVSVNDALNEIEKLEKAKAAREKEITRLSFEEKIAEAERQWNNYYKISDFYGKKVAESMYGELFKGSDSYLQYLEKEQQALRDKKSLTEEEKDNLVLITEKIQSLNGSKTPLENWKDSLSDSLSGVKSFVEQLAIIEKMQDDIFKKEGNSSNFLAFDKDAELQKSNIIKQQKEQFDQLLEEQRTYEEKSLELQKEYDEIKNSERYRNASAYDKGKIDDSFKERFGALDAEMIKSTAEWQVAFGELEGMTNTSLQRILERLLEFQQKTKGTLSVQDSAELQKAIDNVNRAANNNPFAKLSSTFTDYRTSVKESKTAQEEYNRVLRETPKDTKRVEEAGAKMVEADKKALDAKNKLFSQLQKGQEIFNAVGNGILDIADSFGGLDDATKDAVNSIMEVGNAAFELGSAITSGEPAKMIAAGIKMISTIFKALNGDKKKEREIKKQAAQLKELENVYKSLGREIDKALGDKFFAASKAGIENLKQQKLVLEQMIKTESSKKKKDKGKIDDYKEQIKSINDSIEDLEEKMVDKVLSGLNASGLADQLSDALTTAFQNGEDAAEVMGKTVDGILKDMVQNALKMKILEPAMQSVVSKMLKSMGFDENGDGTFDGLTGSEREEIKKLMQMASQNYMNALGEYEELFGAVAGDAQGLKGDIKGVTEKTAGALEGQINAMRVNQVEGLNIQKLNRVVFENMLSQLSQIESNTRRLHSINDSLIEMNSRTKNSLAGI